VRSILDGLGRYERLASRAMVLDEQANHPVGPPPANVIAVYRQATDLMTLELLPPAYNLTLEGGATVREAYTAKRSAVLSGRLWVALAGLVVIAALAALQFFVTARFRRRLNFALAVATLGLIVLTVSATRLLSGEAAHLQAAKTSGFDSILTMSRARAISNSLHADERRFLLDPGRADTYSLAYLDKSQTVLYVASADLSEYYTALGASMKAYRANPQAVRFLGFYGDEARAHPGPAVTAALSRFQQFQADDQRIRQLAAAGHDRQAVMLLTGRTAGSPGYDFDQYDQAVVSLIGQHRVTFDQAIRAGDRELGRSVLGNWAAWLPLAALGAAVLVVAGIWARLAEYR
jgi:Co/Zn/Cd efflux system component